MPRRPKRHVADVSPEPSGQARALPRYQEIKAALIADIKAGAFPVGSLLPTEHQLCRRFEVIE
jgi:DNA-binding GntR family transcriptional regulator